MRITVSPDVLTAHLSGEAVLLNLEDKNYYRLNETAAAVWAGLERGETHQEILSGLLSKYEIDEATASREMDAVIADFREKRLITDT